MSRLFLLLSFVAGCTALYNWFVNCYIVPFLCVLSQKTS